MTPSRGTSGAVPGAGSRRRQGGAAAVEFAFVFPVLFLLIYGVIIYSYIFVLQESINFAAQEAAEAAVQVDPDEDDRDALRIAEIRRTAVNVLGWLPENQRQRVLGDDDGSAVGVQFCTAGNGICPASSDAVTVTLSFRVMEPPLFPVLSLPGLGEVPPLPERLVARATALI